MQKPKAARAARRCDKVDVADDRRPGAGRGQRSKEPPALPPARHVPPPPRLAPAAPPPPPGRGRRPAAAALCAAPGVPADPAGAWPPSASQHQPAAPGPGDGGPRGRGGCRTCAWPQCRALTSTEQVGCSDQSACRVNMDDSDGDGLDAAPAGENFKAHPFNPSPYCTYLFFRPLADLSGRSSHPPHYLAPSCYIQVGANPACYNISWLRYPLRNNNLLFVSRWWSE